MISWTKLLTDKPQEHDNLRYAKNINYFPRIVVWNITKQCNLSCQHCYFEATPRFNSNQLNTQEAKSFIEDVAKLKVAVLLFSGGEPLLREDIFELARFAKEKSIRAVLSTNGTLITKEVAGKIKQAGFCYVGISLDGKEQTNDKFRQTKGAFRSALAGLKNCQNAGLKVGLRFTLTKYNFKDLSAIFDLVERESIPRLCLYHLVYTGRGNNLSSQDLSHEETRRVLEFLWQKTFDFYKRHLKTEILTVDNHADGVWIYLRLKRYNLKRAKEVLELLNLQGGNSSGINIGAVDDCGNVYADQFLRTRPLGNIRQKKFSNIWFDHSNHFLSKLRKRHMFIKGRCQRCNFFSICNGNFRARAEAAYLDPWAEDPACYLTDQEIHKNDAAYSTTSCT